MHFDTEKISGSPFYHSVCEEPTSLGTMRSTKGILFFFVMQQRSEAVREGNINSKTLASPQKKQLAGSKQAMGRIAITLHMTAE